MAVVILGLDDHDRSVDAAVGDMITLRLPENPTTGYRWELTVSDRSVITRADDEYLSGGEASGSGGVHRFELQAHSAGTARVALQLRRAWEPEDMAAQQFSITVHVR